MPFDLAPDEAMIFVSVHANASLNPKSNGFEVWYLPPEYRRELLDAGSWTSQPRISYQYSIRCSRRR
jgi:N-acetylmuramoyl-L-alanine amidase